MSRSSRAPRGHDGGCITRQWSQTLCMAEQVLDLLSDEPDLMAILERLYNQHERRLPKLMAWGSTVSTHHHIDRHRTVSILTSCTRGKGLHSSCWVSSDRQSPTPRRKR